tara:strand:- start:417 stop:890 length:474 start_codon:yes stop_codon:yes gene_type:complete
MKNEPQNTAFKAPNLNANPPRSPRVRHGGYAILPRLLDKCRADIAGLIGEYHTNCTIDREFLDYTGIDYDALRKHVSAGMSDGELLDWIKENTTVSQTPWEIEQWSSYQGHRAPEPHTDSGVYFLEVLASHNKNRGDVSSWADILDLDDYCSFGGAA